MLQIRDLAFSYRKDGEDVFSGLNHSFGPGRLVALTGESGRGKSTLLYVLGLLLRSRRGRIEFDGRDLSGLRDVERSAFRAATIGFVFQDSQLDPRRRVLESIIEPALYAGDRRADAELRARRLLADVGVAHRADHRPGQISGGQAQRIAVARALVNDPLLVFADEPTGNLDQENASAVLDLLSESASGDRRRPRTVIVATHDPFVVRRCDEVVAL